MFLGTWCPAPSWQLQIPSRQRAIDHRLGPPGLPWCLRNERSINRRSRDESQRGPLRPARNRPAAERRKATLCYVCNECFDFAYFDSRLLVVHPFQTEKISCAAKKLKICGIISAITSGSLLTKRHPPSGGLLKNPQTREAS